MLILLLLAAQVTTSTITPPSSGAELARHLKVEMESQTLRKNDMVERFLALPLVERDACLSEWARITEPKGAALEVYKGLRARRDVGITKAVESRRIVERERSARAESASTSKLVLTAQQVDLLISGSRKHAYGAALVVSGVLSLLGAIASGVALASEDQSVAPAAIPGGVGAVLLIVGIVVDSGGSASMRSALAD